MLEDQPPSIASSTTLPIRPNHPHTSAASFAGVGSDERGGRYCLVLIGNRSVLLSASALMAKPKEELKRLIPLGLSLVLNAAQSEFMKRAQDALRQQPTFRVATKIGMMGDAFVFPDRAHPSGHAVDIKMHFEQGHDEVHDKFSIAGSIDEWYAFCRLARGNSRVVAGLALAATGIVCAAFDLEAPGLQFVGRGGIGKTPAARWASALWGWDDSPGVKLGFGLSWNNTSGRAEVLAAAANQTLLFLDDMTNARKDAIEAVMSVLQGAGRGRMTDERRERWCTPFLSTANQSLVAILKGKAIPFDEAYTDRLIDVPKPPDCESFFEDLHGCAKVADYCARMDRLATRSHGRAGRLFVRRFVAKLPRRRGRMKDRVDQWRRDYLRAAEGIEAGGRDLNRVHGRFATIYASGRIAEVLNILPFGEGALLDALLTCERAHVAFVSGELGVAVAPQRPPLGLLQEYIQTHRSEFVDVRDRADLDEDHDHERCAGYIGRHADRDEYWLRNSLFEQVAGGKSRAEALKVELSKLGLLSTDNRDGSKSYVVKRRLPDMSRPYVVAVDTKVRNFAPG